MQYLPSIAILGATLVAAVPSGSHNHGHAHAHRRHAEAEAEPEANQVVTEVHQATAYATVTAGAQQSSQQPAPPAAGSLLDDSFFHHSSSAAAQSAAQPTQAVHQNKYEAAPQQPSAQNTGASQIYTSAKQAPTQASVASSAAASSPASGHSSSGSSKGLATDGIPGHAVVVNNCKSEITVDPWHGGDGTQGAQKVPAGQSSKPLSLSALDGSAWCLKVGFSGHMENIAQVEWSIATGSAPPKGSLCTDLSMIDAKHMKGPFKQYGSSLRYTNDNSGHYPTCLASVCPPNEECKNTYNSNDQNNDAIQPSNTCKEGTGMVFTACDSSES